jgi:hypothetical protein
MMTADSILRFVMPREHGREVARGARVMTSRVIGSAALPCHQSTIARL